MLGCKEVGLSSSKGEKMCWVFFFLQLFRLESICGDSADSSLALDALVCQYLNLVVALGQNLLKEPVQ